MLYSQAMNNMLRELGDEYTALFSYYLDNYYETLEEPIFASTDLRKIWYLLLTDGLLQEIKLKGKHKDLAKLMLRKLVVHNSNWYAAKHFHKPEPTIKRIAERERGVKVIREEGDCVVVRNIKGGETRIRKEFINRWCLEHGNYWQKQGFDLNYPIYHILAEWNQATRKRKDGDYEDL